MNFDRLAPFYPWMECLLAGELMQRGRTAFLSRTTNCQDALLVGEGTGRFLVELLRVNPELKITCVEQSQKMIQLAQRRLVKEQMDWSQIQFILMDALDWTPTAMQFDLVVTHFFLDCFPADQLKQLVPLLAQGTRPETLWLLADFQLPATGWRRLRARAVLAGLYLFFKISTALPARQLTPPDKFLQAAGFTLVERRLFDFGLVHSDVWRKSKRGTFADLNG